jgi:hypothetical protein
MRKSCVVDESPTQRTIALIEVAEDEYAFTVGVAESTSSGPVLLMMCDVTDPGPHEVGQGMDTYCLVREDQAATFYGGVDEVHLERHSLALRFRPDAAEALSVQEQVRWTLAVSDADHELLAHGLRRVFSFGREDQRPVLTGV